MEFLYLADGDNKKRPTQGILPLPKTSRRKYYSICGFSQMTEPGRGLLTEVTLPMLVARTDEYSNARLASGANVQSSRTRFLQ